LLEALTRRGPFKPIAGASLDHVVRTKKVFHTADMAAEPVLGWSTKLGGARSQVTVPMLNADQVGEIERMGRLRRFLPPQVADLIVASGSEKQLERPRSEQYPMSPPAFAMKPSPVKF